MSFCDFNNTAAKMGGFAGLGVRLEEVCVARYEVAEVDFSALQDLSPSSKFANMMPGGAYKAFTMLLDDIRDGYIVPALQAQTSDAYIKAFVDNVHRFQRSWDAVTEVLSVAIGRERLAGLANDEKAEADAETELIKSAVQLRGDDAQSEIEFCLSTLKAAHRLAGRLHPLKTDNENRERDMQLALHYRLAQSLNTFAMLSLVTASAASSGTEIAIDAAFECCRMGAMEAYSAAREGVELRTSVSDDPSEIPADFSDEDLALAEAISY
ncbi:MAG TPA: hypothetical protein VFN67_29915 [Polyangiales bacterium]|nr:hypothetical protein [Polyangiales bacterium]